MLSIAEAVFKGAAAAADTLVWAAATFVPLLKLLAMAFALAVAIHLASAGRAHAEEPEAGAPAPSASYFNQNLDADRAYRILQGIFGEALFPASAARVTTSSEYTGSGVNDAENPGGAVSIDTAILPQLISGLNAIIAGFAGLILFYYYVTAIVQTAHDGEFLGRRYSTLWMPFRLVVALSLLAPMSGGYTFGQHFIAWVASEGLSAGNYFWNQSTQMLAGGATPVVPAQGPTTTEVIAYSFVSGACVYTHQYLHSLPGEEPAGVMGMVMSSSDSAAWMTAEQSISFGGLPNTLFPADVCGQVKWPAPSTFIANLPTDGQGRPLYNSGAVLAAKILPKNFEIYSDAIAHAYAMGKEAAAISISHQKSIRATPDLEPYRQKLRDLARDTDKAVFAASSAAISGYQSELQAALKAAMTANGWGGAGDWFVTMSNINGHVQNLMSVQPEPAIRDEKAGTGRTVTGPLTAIGWLFGFDMPPAYRTEFGIYMRPIADVIGQMQRPTSVENVAATGANSTDAGAVSRTVRDMTDNSSAAWNSGQWSILQEFMPSEGRAGRVNPLGEMMSTGNTLISIGLAIAGASAVGQMVPAVNPATAIIQKAGELAMPLGFALTGAGMTLAYVVPFVPAATWFFAVVAWLGFVSVAIIAAPLWAISHIDFKGEGLSPSAARAGIQMIINIATKPVLMTFSMILAIALFLLGARGLQDMIFTGYFAIIANSPLGAGATGLFTFAVLAMASYVALAFFSFRLITVSTDWALRMLGFRGEMYDDEQAPKSTYAAGAGAGAMVGRLGKGGPLSRGPGGGGSEEKAGSPQGRIGSGSGGKDKAAGSKTGGTSDNNDIISGGGG